MRQKQVLCWVLGFRGLLRGLRDRNGGDGVSDDVCDVVSVSATCLIGVLLEPSNYYDARVPGVLVHDCYIGGGCCGVGVKVHALDST